MFRRALLVLFVLLPLAGCTSKPIMNVSNEPIVVASGRTATMDNVRDSILRAGTKLGWQMTPSTPGVVDGRLSLRDHVAIIDVKYDTRSFSIVYRDSSNLDYRSGQIHRNYNGWIENLNREIRAELLRV